MKRKSFLGLEERIKIAKKLTLKSHQSILIGKEAFYKQIDMTLSEAYDYASNVMVENMLKFVHF